MDAVYNCTGAWPLEGPNSPSGDVLPDGAVLFRKQYARGRNLLKGNCALGQLSADGILQHTMNGRNLRAA
jgi:hypothetical protein